MLLLRGFRHRGVVVNTWMLVFAISLIPLRVALPAIQDDCARKLEKARASFIEGAFDRSITLVNECLEVPDLPDWRKVMAYDLLARSLFKKNVSSLRAKVKDAIGNLLALEQDYSPPAEAEEGYKKLVDEVRNEQCDCPVWPWILAGALGAVSGGIAVYLMTK